MSNPLEAINVRDARYEMYVDLLNRAGWSMDGDFVTPDDSEGTEVVLIRSDLTDGYDPHELAARLSRAQRRAWASHSVDGFDRVAFGYPAFDETVVELSPHRREKPNPTRFRLVGDVIYRGQLGQMGRSALDTLIAYGNELSA